MSSNEAAPPGKDVRWYIESIDGALTDYMRELLIDYSKVPSADLEKHLYAVRETLWRLAPYPCVGYWSFLKSNLHDCKAYSTILAKAKAGERVLDLGTCVGQELRVLVNDGAPSGNLYGADITTQFWPVGFDLFQDKDSFKATFIQSDVLDDASEMVSKLGGSCEVVWLGLLLHLFSYDLQVEASKQIVKLTKGKGSIIAGKSGGWDKAGVEERKLNIQNEGRNNEPTRFRHDKASFEKMWAEVAQATGTEWEVHIDVVPDTLAWRHPQDGPALHRNEWLYFTLTRTA